MLRSCYRSYWRLHQDNTILTPGRFYFVPEDTPAAPFPTLLSSKNWERDDYPAARIQQWGEWDGNSKYDRGTPPVRVPAPKLVGSLDCLANGASSGGIAPAIASPESVRVVCIGGIVYSFPSVIYICFSVGYADRRYTYFENVELFLVEADCEARYEGDSRIANTKAVVRVTEGPGGTLHTNFYLCETAAPPPPPIVTPCCGTPVPATITQTYRIYGSFPAGPFSQTWAIELEDIEMVYYEESPIAFPPSDVPAWYAFFDEDDLPTDPDTCTYIVRKFCLTPETGEWFNQIYTPGGFNVVGWNSVSADFDCATGRAERGFAALPTTYGSGFINGHGFDSTFGDFIWVEME